MFRNFQIVKSLTTLKLHNSMRQPPPEPVGAGTDRSNSVKAPFSNEVPSVALPTLSRSLAPENAPHSFSRDLFHHPPPPPPFVTDSTLPAFVTETLREGGRVYARTGVEGRVGWLWGFWFSIGRLNTAAAGLILHLQHTGMKLVSAEQKCLSMI